MTDSDADRKYKGLAGITKRLIFSKFDLMRKIDDLERQLEHVIQSADECLAENRILARQLAEAQKDQADAKRYRWIRQCSEGSPQAYVILTTDYESMDAAIDAAIAQQKVKT